MMSWLGNRNKFYKISSSGLTFEIKTDAYAAIGLAKQPGDTCDIWIVIGYYRTWIKEKDGGYDLIRYSNVLSFDEFTKFWITWKNGVVQVGVEDSKNTLVSYNYTKNLSYVTFSTYRCPFARFNRVHWRIEMPPIRETQIMKTITNGELMWVQASNSLPDGALIGGYEDEMLYIMRAPHQGSLTPGKLIPSTFKGYIAWGYDAHEKIEFEVLCGYDCIWVPTCEDKIPVGAVEGGYVENSMETMFVGRAYFNGHLIPGKIAPSHKVCYIPFEGKTIAVKNYDILVSPNINTQSANSFFLERTQMPAENVHGLIDFMGGRENEYENNQQRQYLFNDF